jgi:hypothetical protein
MYVDLARLLAYIVNENIYYYNDGISHLMDAFLPKLFKSIAYIVS